METLPKWASAYLAVTCAEMIAPAIETLWPDAPQAERQLLEEVIRKTKQSAESGVQTADLDDLAGRITELVGRFTLFRYGKDIGDPEIVAVSELSFSDNVDLTQVKVFQSVFDVAARAARIATCDDRESAFEECGNALQWGRAVMDHLADGADIDAQLEQMLDSLWDFCADAHMSDDDGIVRTDDGWKIVKS